MKTLKSLLVIFSILILNLIFLIPSFAAGASLSLSPSSGTFNKGCSFSVDIKVDTGGAQTDGTDVILFYDPTRLSAGTIRSGTIYSEYPGNNIDAQNGKITVSGLASASSAFSGSGTLATVDFTVLNTAPAGTTQMKFDFDPNDKSKSTDSNIVERGTVADILNSVQDGSFTIGSGTCNNKIPVGGIDDGSSSAKPTIIQEITKTPPSELPQSADSRTTIMFAAIGSILTILGILGLALL